jgi:hypothetical protein
VMTYIKDDREKRKKRENFNKLAWIELIPTAIDQNRCAQSRKPMDMMSHG